MKIIALFLLLLESPSFALVIKSVGIGALSIDTTKIAADAVTTVKILNAAVDTSKLATDSVSTAKLLTATGSLIKVSGGAAMADSSTSVTFPGTATVQGNAFSVGGSELFVKSDGNVGIGTSIPQTRFDVKADPSGYGASFIGRNADGAAVIRFTAADGTTENAGIVGLNGVLTLRTGASVTTAVTIDASQRVGIGTTNPGSNLSVVGTIAQTLVTSCTLGLTTTSTGAITGCAASDRSLKTDISQLNIDSGAVIDRLSPVYYRWLDKERGVGRKAGFVAQDVEKVLPEAVVSAGKGLKGVDSNALVAVLVKEIQELRKRITNLEKTR